MSVNIVTGLADAYTALTGLETVQTATGIMVNNSGSWISASDSTIYNVLKNGGCKAVGQVTHISPNAWNVVGYEPKIGQFLYEGSSALKVDYMWSVPDQYAGNALARTQTISNAGRAALQNNGAQIGSKVLQPITKMEIVQSTGGTTLKTTSKGILTKVPLKAAMRACAAAQGIMLGIDFVESNPQLATKLSNAIFRTDLDPDNIASIVENTTVWANIRDGAVFLTEDLINCIKNVFMDEHVFDDASPGSGMQNSVSADGSVSIYLAGIRAGARNAYRKAKIRFNKMPFADSSVKACFNVSQTTENRTVTLYSTARPNFGLSGFSAGTSESASTNINDEPVDPQLIQNWSPPFNESATHVYKGVTIHTWQINAEYFTSAWGDNVISAALPCHILFRATRSEIDALLVDDVVPSSAVPIVYPGVLGTAKIPGSTYPTPSGTIASDYPDWWNKRVETLEGNNDTGEIVPVPWLPVNIFQPTGDDPNEYNQQDSQDGDVNDDDNISVIVDTFDDALEDNEQDPDPDPDPYPYPNPNPAPDPTLVKPITPIPPIEDPSDGVSPDPTNPIITTAATSGLAHIYNPTLSEVQAVSRKLWTLDFLENLKKIFVDPMDGIIGFLIIYATPKTTNPEDIVLGVYNTNVTAKVVTNQYITIDCGSVTVNEFFNDARDYAPYTTVSLYLPFIGVVSLYADDIINSHVNIVYHIDVLTGTCLATVKVIKQGASAVIYQYPGNCAVQIPLTSMNYSSIVTSLFSVGISAVGGAALGTAKAVGRRAAGALYGAARSAAINASTSQIEVQQSGSIGSNAGVMGIRTPYFIIRRPVINDAYGYPQQYGYPANKWVVLGTMKGFTRIKAIHLDSLVCTDEEKEMLDSLLKEGVVF